MWSWVGWLLTDETRHNASLLLDLAENAIAVSRPELARLSLYPEDLTARQQLNGKLNALIDRGLIHVALDEIDEGHYPFSLADFMVDKTTAFRSTCAYTSRVN